MPQHHIHLHWDATEDDERYSWTLDSGAQMLAIDPTGESDKPDYMDPEETFLASICSCHLLSFVTEAAREGFSVKRYSDDPVGVLAKNKDGRLFVAQVLLTPKASFGGDNKPSNEQIIALHNKARAKCIISNSILTEITVEPRLPE